MSATSRPRSRNWKMHQKPPPRPFFFYCRIGPIGATVRWIPLIVAPSNGGGGVGAALLTYLPLVRRVESWSQTGRPHRWASAWNGGVAVFTPLPLDS
jgi:hypothetical protein